MCVIAGRAHRAHQLLHRESSSGVNGRLLGPDGLQFTTAEDDAIKPGYAKLRYLDKADAGADIPKTADGKPNKFLWVKNTMELGGKAVKSAVAFINPHAVDYSIHGIPTLKVDSLTVGGTAKKDSGGFMQ